MVKNLKTNKALGLDGLTNEFDQTVEITLNKYLSQVEFFHIPLENQL